LREERGIFDEEGKRFKLRRKGWDYCASRLMVYSSITEASLWIRESFESLR